MLCENCPHGQKRKYFAYVNCLASERTPENCALLASILADGAKRARLELAAERLADAERKADEAREILLQELYAPSDSLASGVSLRLGSWEILISQGWSERISPEALRECLPQDVFDGVAERVAIRNRYCRVTVLPRDGIER